MRYQVNEVLPVITIFYKGDGRRNLLFTPYMPWFNQQIERVEFEHLTVTEHHRVHSEYNEGTEPDCDGYLLKTSKGEVMSNQYPRASYAQMNDRANRLFNRYFKGDEHADFENWFAQNPNGAYQYQLLANYLADLKDGIEARKTSKDLVEADHVMTQLLQDHLDAVIAQYEQETGKVVVFGVSEFGFFSEVTFADKEGAAA